MIGKGGFGAVYRATDTNLGREVALKILHPQLMVDVDFIERFRREARALAVLDHPNIVSIYELDEVDGRIFIAAKYYPGGSLRQKLAAQGKLPYPQALHILQQVSAGLQAGHEAGLVHRDVKPENILFDKRGQAVVSDFGLAKVLQQGSSAASSGNTYVGTPSYMAPEVWQNKPASPATDVYALACVFYEMLSGQVLFQGDSAPAIMLKHFIELELPKGWPPDAPAGLNEVLRKALAKEPGERYSDTAAFCEALDALKPAGAVEAGKNIPPLTVPISAQPVSREKPVEPGGGPRKMIEKEIASQKPLAMTEAKELPRWVAWGAGIIILVGLALAGGLVINHGNSFVPVVPTQTPTLTSTSESTFTPTTTVTLVPTSTLTSQPTRAASETMTPTAAPTRTATPQPYTSATPLVGTLARLVWARAGCYDAYDAVGSIPEGGNVRFLPSDRRFDAFNRECALVEYDNGQSSIIGWILIADLVN